MEKSQVASGIGEAQPEVQTRNEHGVRASVTVRERDRRDRGEWMVHKQVN